MPCKELLTGQIFPFYLSQKIFMALSLVGFSHNDVKDKNIKQMKLNSKKIQFKIHNLEPKWEESINM